MYLKALQSSQNRTTAAALAQVKYVIAENSRWKHCISLNPYINMSEVPSLKEQQQPTDSRLVALTDVDIP
jgi:hypothetical protein